MEKKRPILYADETSTHMWERRIRCWTKSDSPLKVTIPAKRGKSQTIYGAIGKGIFKKNQILVHTVADSTNT